MKKLYLALYNLLSAFAWLYVLFLTVTTLIKGEKLWPNIQLPLQITQFAAVLEIVHAALGIVPSAIIPTFIQVFSRITILFLYTSSFRACQRSLSLPLMVLSWALVEPPRYFYYTWNLLSPKTIPFPLLWLRYSLFSILYPTGILGEIGQILSAIRVLRRACKFCPLLGLPRTSLFGYYLSYFLLLLYIPGSPFMYTHMLKQRRSVFRRLKAPPPPSPLRSAVAQRPPD